MSAKRLRKHLFKTLQNIYAPNEYVIHVLLASTFIPLIIKHRIYKYGTENLGITIIIELRPIETKKTRRYKI